MPQFNITLVVENVEAEDIDDAYVKIATIVADIVAKNPDLNINVDMPEEQPDEFEPTDVYGRDYLGHQNLGDFEDSEDDAMN